MRGFAKLVASVSLLVAGSALAESTATLEKVHLCCKSCVTGAEKAVSAVSGAKATCDKDAGKVTITAPDAATAQKAVDALVKAGYYGSISGDAKLPEDKTPAGTVKSAEVSGVHNCCKKCTTAINDTIKSVPGTSGEMQPKEKKVTVTGNFDEKKLDDAFHQNGLNAKIEGK